MEQTILQKFHCRSPRCGRRVSVNARGRATGREPSSAAASAACAAIQSHEGVSGGFPNHHQNRSRLTPLPAGPYWLEYSELDGYRGNDTQ
jgi:hypothetical protein